MPQLDFREALSSPNEKLFSSPTTLTAAPATSVDKTTSGFARGVQFSRSTWANIFFVTIASLGGLACAFYFFNGGELLRAAAAWPNEFLYPRPLLTDKIDIGQPNPVDQFTNNEAGSTKTDEAKAPLGKNVGPPEFSQLATAIGASNPTVTAPIGSGATLLPTAPSLPATPSLPSGLDLPSAPSTDSLFQSLYQTAVSTAPPKKITRTANSTRSSTRRKVSITQHKLAGQTRSATSVARSTTQNMQQTSNQTQTPMNAIQAPKQMMMGGGLSGGLGGAVGGVGGAVGGVGGGLGGGIGGIGGLGGGLGGHH